MNFAQQYCKPARSLGVIALSCMLLCQQPCYSKPEPWHAHAANILSGISWAGTMLGLAALHKKPSEEISAPVFVGACAIIIPTVLTVNFYIHSYLNASFQKKLDGDLNKCSSDESLSTKFERFRVRARHTLDASKKNFWCSSLLMAALLYRKGFGDKAAHLRVFKGILGLF